MKIAIGRAVVAVSILWCLSSMNLVVAASKPELRGEVPVKWMKVEMNALPIYAQYPGTVISVNQVKIASRLMGYIREIKVHAGQSVKKGQLLLVMDQSDVLSRINQAHAGVEKAKAALAVAQSNYRRYRTLYKEQAIPQQQFEQFQLAYQAAKSDYQAARAALHTAKSQQSYARIRAPFSGTIVQKLVDQGQLAGPGQPLLVIQSAGHMQVETQVDALAFRHLRLGQSVNIVVDGANLQAQVIQGVVERLVAAADPMTHTHLVKIGLPAQSAVYPGEYATVKVKVGSESGILVPRSALYDRGGITGVFVVDTNHQAAFRMVRVGPSVNHQIAILSGLIPGEVVIISHQSSIQNGTRVGGASS